MKYDHKAPWVRLAGHYERQLTWSTTSAVFPTAISVSEMQLIFTIPKDQAAALTGGLLLSAMLLLSLQTIPRAFAAIPNLKTDRTQCSDCSQCSVRKN